MDWGMKNRLARIIRPETNRCVMLAIDHGYFQGPTTGLEEPGETVAPLLPHADALMLTRGILRNSIDPSHRIPIVLHYMEGLSFAEVAEAMGLPEGTAKSRASRGLERMREAVGAAGGRRYGLPLLLPLLEGLPSTRIQRQRYENICPAESVIGLPEGAEYVAAALSMDYQPSREAAGQGPADMPSYRGPRGFWYGADLAVLPHGDGRIIFSTFLIPEHLGRDPAADRLFSNLVSRYQSGR